MPLDLSGEAILRRLRQLYDSLGDVSEENEEQYSSGVAKLIAQLEIYDQVQTVRDIRDSLQKGPEDVRHSQHGIELARKMVEILENNEGSAECFPYEQIEGLKKEFGLE